jgi:hypothetical protein
VYAPVCSGSIRPCQRTENALLVIAADGVPRPQSKSIAWSARSITGPGEVLAL